MKSQRGRYLFGRAPHDLREVVGVRLPAGRVVLVFHVLAVPVEDDLVGRDRFREEGDVLADAGQFAVCKVFAACEA